MSFFQRLYDAFFSGDGREVVSTASVTANEEQITSSLQRLNINKSWPKKMNHLFDDIFKRYIKIKQDSFELHYSVFMDIFKQLDEKMKNVDAYYGKYNSRKQCAGSHYDNLRIVEPNEFDMDIVIRLPANYNVDEKTPSNTDILLEYDSPAYLKLKMGKQFQKLPHRNALIDNVAYGWMDPKTNYLLRSLFQQWFKSVVDKALNQFNANSAGEKIINIRGKEYKIRLSEGGPAVTLRIMDCEGFLCEVDLVPALRLPESRWPPTKKHKPIPANCSAGYWMVVPKPKKGSTNQDTTWRIAVHDQEYMMMRSQERMKQGIRFMKKLRDALNMNKIASYYIKTLFFHQLEVDTELWKQPDAKIFHVMVLKLRDALNVGSIPYLWHGGYNLLEGIHSQVLKRYAIALEPLIQLLDQPDTQDKCKSVAKILLTAREYRDYDRYCSNNTAQL